MGKKITLSVLIATVPNRISTFYPRLINSLLVQTENKDVEILGLFDNKKRSVGEKRNDLISLAQGKYLTFIDDDDWIAGDYVDSILTCLAANPDADCVVFDCITTVNGDVNKRTYSKYSIRYRKYSQTAEKVDGYLQWRGKPAHTMVWKSEIAKRHTYKSINYAEDVDWVGRASQDIKQEVRIDKVLYYYDFDSKVSETRG